MRFSFILLAGGNSNRFKSNLPKPYHKIGKKTLIELSINKIRQFKEFKKIIVVCNEKHFKFKPFNFFMKLKFNSDLKIFDNYCGRYCSVEHHGVGLVGLSCLVLEI